MSNDRGVFTLSAYRRAQVEGQGVDLNDVWVPPAPIATSDASYMVGGLMNEYNTSNTASDISSQTDKITYSSSTTSRLPGANLDNAMYGGVGMSSLLAMYSGGGPNVPGLNPNQTNVRKLTYASETWALLPHATAGLKVEPKESTQGVGDASNFGYFFGGEPGTTSYTQKFAFAYESSSRVPGADLPYSFYGATAAGTQEKAYVTGGSTGPWSSFKTNVTKFTYSGETMADVPGLRLSDDKYKGYGEAAAANSQYIWYAGGSQTSPQGGAIKGQTTVSRIDMSADTIQESLPSTQLTYPTFKHGGVDNGSDGYFAGGNSWNGPSPGGPYSSANKLTFSNGTMAATPGANLTQAKSLMQTAGPRQYSTPSPAPGGSPYRWKDGFKEDDLKAGYYQGGGNPSTSNSATQKVSFVSDVASLVPGGSLPQNGGIFAGVNSNSIKTILSGGEPGGDAFMKFVYTTETSSNLAGSMPSRRNYNNDMGYGTESVGYVTGGGSEPSNPGFYHSGTQKIEYATDTTSDVPGANSNQPLAWMGAFGNVDHTLGYIVGGITKGPGQSAVSRIQKMTYSTETIANTPANMQNNYFNLGTTSGPDAGYIYSKQEYPGYTANGAIEKFVYATDSRTTVPQPSYYPTYGANGTGNSTNGYYGGGYSPSSPGHRFTRILKLNFSTGVGQDLPSSQFTLPSGVYRSAASSAVARKKSPKGEPVPTPTPKAPGPAFNGAIWMGGYNALTNQYTSSGGKIDFSTDVITNLPSTQLTKQSYDLAATSSLLAGYYAQGAPSNTSIVKVDYATSSPSTLTSNLSGGPGAGGNDARRRGASFGLKTAGYFMQGDTGSSGNLSNLDKITYSSDTSARLPASGTPTGSYATVGASNQTNGYQTGGTPGGGTMRKMPFATESWGNAPGANFPEMWDAKSMSNITHGYFIGGSGNANGTRVYKLTFATDSTSQLPTNFPQYSRYGWGTGNSTHGYASGGVNTGSITTRIYKLQYSNDTWSITPNRITGGAIQQNAAASARQNGNGNTIDNVTPNVV